MLLSLMNYTTAKTETYGYHRYEHMGHEKRKAVTKRILQVSTINEKSYTKGSELYYFALFEKAHPILWKKKSKKAEMFKNWLDTQQLQEEIDSTPYLGYGITLKGLQETVFPEVIEEWMVSSGIWEKYRTLADVIKKTPMFGYKIKIFEEIPPIDYIKFYNEYLAIFMLNFRTWENTRNLMLYRPSNKTELKKLKHR